MPQGIGAGPLGGDADACASGHAVIAVGDAVTATDRREDLRT